MVMCPKMRLKIVLTGIVAALWSPPRAAAAGAAAGPVFVLALANDESFDRDLPVLRYAQDDLARFTNVMVRTGLVPADHVTALHDGTAKELRAAFADVARKASGAAPGSKLIFYFTGHSDVNGLHLADGLLRKDELHALLRSVATESRIAFFDGCYSGALAAKGVKPAGEFVVPHAELDEPTGSVFFAATSGTDVAYEVEELKGSLFSHHLVDGLYGAADGNHDGLVTIDELYQHVYKQMGAYAAALPAARAQKPEYSVDLHGRGALVLSYLAKTTAPVEIDASVGGEVTLTSDDGLQIFRLDKRAGEPLRLMLVPGSYAVTVRRGDELGRGTLAVRDQSGGLTRLARQDLTMTRAPNLDLVAKGQRAEARWGVAAGLSNGSMLHAGPAIELQAATHAVRIETSDWRLVALAGGHRNELELRDQRGQGSALSLVLGAQGAFHPAWVPEGQFLKVLLGGGADYAWQRWDDAEDPQVKTFDPMMPKVAIGLATTFTRDSGRVWGLSYRREFPFAKEERSGDVLAFGANLFAVTVEW
jgi:hypothetical protein